MKKKILCGVIALSLICSICGCSSNSTNTAPTHDYTDSSKNQYVTFDNSYGLSFDSIPYDLEYLDTTLPMESVEIYQDTTSDGHYYLYVVVGIDVSKIKSTEELNYLSDNFRKVPYPSLTTEVYIKGGKNDFAHDSLTYLGTYKSSKSIWYQCFGTLKGNTFDFTGTNVTVAPQTIISEKYENSSGNTKNKTISYQYSIDDPTFSEPSKMSVAVYGTITEGLKKIGSTLQNILK